MKPVVAISLLGLAASAAYAGLVLSIFTAPAFPHDAPKGWSYPFSCCSGVDCRPVSSGRGGIVVEKPEGYVISTTGELVRYADIRVRPSPDGDFHWCSVAGADDGRTICLFVPPRGM